MQIAVLKQSSIALKYIFQLLFFFLVGIFKTNAQQVIVPPRSNDSVRVILIKQAKSLREKNIDSATIIKTAACEVIIVEGRTTTNCDSAVYNQRTNILEAFGNIHINDADSIHTYAQYLRYIGLDRIAYLKKNVRLTDKKGTLYTDDLEYNLRTGIATYKNGGRVVNGKTILTSKEGIYYADSKDIYFKKNVHFKDDNNTIITDSLLYNLKTGIATFIAPTNIKSKDGTEINTKSGTYNLNTGEAIFYDRTTYKDSTHSITGDKMAFDKKSGTVQIDGNGKLVDSANQVTVIGNSIFLDVNKNAFLATRKPVMIFYRDGDSTYLAADTIFSGLRKYDSLERRMAIKNDTLKKVEVIDGSKSKDSSIRYFLAFHNVRIFNDSLQAVSDSLHYSTSDSTFKLFGNPLVWNAQTQVKGDTIHMYTENQKPKRLYVFNNGLIINEANKALYNQIGGRTINAYFKDGQIDYVRVKGSPAESIFYPQDDDSAYTGMNRSSGDVIDIFFVNKELNKVKFIKDVDGIMYPINQIPADKKELKGFMWLDKRRPKNKLALFE
ncbi:MAG: LPS export ABC transporter periplasmic protein LptC [Ferruginibacter sp.]|nr:LPS export ABC transporter periplasmic protein LptC [Ferruginibacter sp.]